MTKDIINSAQQSQSLMLTPENPKRLANFCGRLNEHIHQVEQRLQVKVRNRGHHFVISTKSQTKEPAIALYQAEYILKELYRLTQSGLLLDPEKVHLVIQESGNLDWIAKQSTAHTNPDNMHNPVHSPKDSHYINSKINTKGPHMDNVKSTNSANDSKKNNDLNSELNSAIEVIKTPKCSIKPRSNHQNEYVRAVVKHDINFGIGPAGTGKTYLAVACAVEALTAERVSRILLVRPAVEAGEKLGFLPGDLAQKVDPYLRPLYDALYEMLGFEKVAKLMERNIIEVAPLAYMRGRTLNNAFIILDESQNTTASQMKMFLTRIGYGSTAVITGDVTQIDLPHGDRSGLVQVSNILDGIEGINFTYFDSKDVVRHPIVQKIVEAYEKHDQQNISTIQPKEQ